MPTKKKIQSWFQGVGYEESFGLSEVPLTEVRKMWINTYDVIWRDIVYHEIFYIDHLHVLTHPEYDLDGYVDLYFYEVAWKPKQTLERISVIWIQPESFKFVLEYDIYRASQIN